MQAGNNGGGVPGEAEEEGFWWEESVEGLIMEELERYKDSLQVLMNNVALKLEDSVMRRNCERDFLSFI